MARIGLIGVALLTLGLATTAQAPDDAMVGAEFEHVVRTGETWQAIGSRFGEELRRAGKPVKTRVEPGPANPLGKFWLGLSEPNYGIHGTNAPLSIYRFQTHGCVRLHPDDVVDLWTHASVGMPGENVYEPVLLAITKLETFLEAHPDIYRRISADAEASLRSIATARGVVDHIDWAAVKNELRQRNGHLARIDGDVIKR